MLKAKSNAQSILVQLINASVDTFNVADGSSFPSENFLISIDDEIMLVGSRSGDTFSSVTREYEDTTAAEHVSGSAVENRFTAGAHMEMTEAIEKNADDLVTHKNDYAILNAKVTNATLTTQTQTANTITLPNVVDGQLRTALQGRTYQNGAENGEFVDTTGWMGNVATIAVANNAITATGNGTGASIGIFQASANAKMAVNEGDRVFVRALCTPLSAGSNSITFALHGTTSGSIGSVVAQSNPQINITYSLGVVFTIPSGFVGNARALLMNPYPDASTANGKAVKFEKVCMVNLTALYDTETDLDILAQKYTFVDGMQSVGNVRVRSVNEDEAEESIAYYTLPSSEKLKSVLTGIYDEVTENGKYIKRTNEIELNTLSWTAYAATETRNPDLKCFYATVSGKALGQRNICSIIPFISFVWDAANNLSISGHQSTQNVYIVIEKSRLSTADSSGFIAWLTDNAITLIYELATPNEPVDLGVTPVTCFEGGTVYVEPVSKKQYKYADSKVTFDSEVSSIESIEKYENGEYAPVTDYTLASGGMSATITGATNGEYYEVIATLADTVTPTSVIAYPTNLAGAVQSNTIAINQQSAVLNNHDSMLMTLALQIIDLQGA